MEKYKGYKGMIIEVVGRATAWRDGEKVVIYKRVEKPEWFSMPERVFNGDVEDEETHKVYKRWTLITEEGTKEKEETVSTDDFEKNLKQYFGHDSFRGSQREVVESIVKGRDTVCVMPTGAGKSLCYQLPGMMLEGTTVVISPLIALMQDQVRYLNEKGIPAACLNSTLTYEQYKQTTKELAEGKYKFLYVAPERLASGAFLSLCNSIEIPLFAIDEAHCISEWGNSFRPDYRRVGAFIKKLHKRPIVAAFTATATDKVKKDIIANLGLKDSFCITTGFDRANLKYSVIFPENKKETLRRILHEHAGESGIVYCITRKDVDNVCKYLKEKGIDALRYHGGVDYDERIANQASFLDGTTDIIVATKAFGMGIDKSDIRLVVNYNMPDSIEMYYQEAGRAGRDGKPADCILLYSPSDVVTNQHLMENDENQAHLNAADKEIVRKGNEERLRQMTFYATCNDCLRRRILTYFGDPAELYCDNCSNCLGKYELVDITEDAKKIIECLKESGQRYGIDKIADTLKGAGGKKVKEKHLDRLKTYKCLEDKDKITIRHEIRTLINEGYLRQEGEYNVIKINEAANEILTGVKTVSARAYDSDVMQHNDIKPQNISKAVSHPLKQYDQRLYDELSTWRAEQAKKEGYKDVYMVLQKAVLQSIAVEMPISKAELLSIKGIGPVKYEKYGDALIEIVKKYKN